MNNPIINFTDVEQVVKTVVKVPTSVTLTFTLEQTQFLREMCAENRYIQSLFFDISSNLRKLGFTCSDRNIIQSLELKHDFQTTVANQLNVNFPSLKTN